MNQLNAVITEDTKTLHKDGVLHLLFSDEPLNELKHFVKLRGLRPGSIVLFNIVDKESKSIQQLRTVHLMLRIYDKFLQANIEGHTDIQDLKNTIKYKYGVIDYWEAPDKKVLATLKSFADYKMPELAKLISGLMDEMIKVFSEYIYEDKQFSDMVKEFNSQKIEKVREMFELF